MKCARRFLGAVQVWRARRIGCGLPVRASIAGRHIYAWRCGRSTCTRGRRAVPGGGFRTSLPLTSAGRVGGCRSGFGLIAGGGDGGIGQDRSTSASRCLRHSSRCRAGRSTSLERGTRRTLARGRRRRRAGTVGRPSPATAREDGRPGPRPGLRCGADQAAHSPAIWLGHIASGHTASAQVTQQVLGTAEPGPADAVGRSAVLRYRSCVRHGAGTTGCEDTAPERGQRPLAQEVRGQQVRGGHWEVLFVRLGTRFGGERRSGTRITWSAGSAPVSVAFAAATGRWWRSGANKGVYRLVLWSGPGDQLDDFCVVFHLLLVHHHQEHARGLWAHPGGHGAWRGAAGL